MNTDNLTSKKVILKELGTIDYQDAWDIQKLLQKQRIDKLIEDTLIVCQHNPVVTIGKSAKSQNVLFSEELLRQKSIDIFKIERGGDVTFHEPGQLVAYPILDLNNFKRDVGWYMRQLEEIAIKTCGFFSIKAERFVGRTGVWIIPKHNDSFYSGDLIPRKITSIGVRLSRWCSMHGVGFNIGSDLSGFNLINPCGFTDIKMTSLVSEIKIQTGKHIEDENLFFEQAQSKWIEYFAETFEVKII